MLSRDSSNATRRPLRHKSTPSFRYQAKVSSDLNSAEPEVVDPDALTAANLAYERANRGKRSNQSTNESKDPTEVAKDESRLKRTQSIRFVGQNSNTITRREVPRNNNSEGADRNSVISGNANCADHANSEAWITALPDDFGEEHVASQPSSYRKLRKAKSLFNPAKVPAISLASRVPGGRGHFKRHSLQPSVIHDDSTSLTAPPLHRSFSFVRGVTDRISATRAPDVSHDAAIQLARDTFLHQVEQQRLRQQPSFLNLNRHHRSRKAFKRTVRTSSSNSYGSAISSPLSSIENGKNIGSSSKTRKFSQVWKEKVKSLFKRQSADERSVPAQQLEAKHTHYGEYDESGNNGHQCVSHFPEHNSELLHRVRSRDSSLHSEPGFVSKSPRPGSIRSVSSDWCENNDRSRVTSWTDSSASNTVNMPIFTDRKRLSIIQEDGGSHQPSSSLRLAEHPSHIHSPFYDPVETEAGPLEAQRIYSALQRQMKENKRNSAIGDSEVEGAFGYERPNIHNPLLLPTRQPSRRLSGSRTKISTIAAREPEKVYLSDVKSNASAGSQSSRTFDHGTSEGIFDGYQRDYADLTKDLTPQEIARLNESSPQLTKRPLREVKSTFFPTSMRIERSKQSPFRRAMHASGEDEDRFLRSKFVDQRATIIGRGRDESVARSESVYSGSSGGHALECTGSALSVTSPESRREYGADTLIAKHCQQFEQSPHQHIPRRQSSATLNAAWKKGFDCEKSSVRDVHGLEIHISHSVPKKANGHRRESADVIGDDVQIGPGPTTQNLVQQPLSIVHGNGSARSRSRLHGLLPARSASLTRGTTNEGSENVPLTAASTRSPQLHPKDSLLSLISQPDPNGSKQSPRNSPERDERLRRLRNSNVKLNQVTPPGDENSSPYNGSCASGNSTASPKFVQRQAGKNNRLVNSFLRTRRSQMRISEEDGSSPAFL